MRKTIDVRIETIEEEPFVCIIDLINWMKEMGTPHRLVSHINDMRERALEAEHE